MDTNDKLRRLMKRHSLTRQDVARLTKATISCVNRWLVAGGEKNSTYRRMPEHRLDSLVHAIEKNSTESVDTK